MQNIVKFSIAIYLQVKKHHGPTKNGPIVLPKTLKNISLLPKPKKHLWPTGRISTKIVMALLKNGPTIN